MIIFFFKYIIYIGALGISFNANYDNYVLFVVYYFF